MKTVKQLKLMRTGIYLGLISIFSSLFEIEQYYEPYSTSGGVEILSIGVS